MLLSHRKMLVQPHTDTLNSIPHSQSRNNNKSHLDILE